MGGRRLCTVGVFEQLEDAGLGGKQGVEISFCVLGADEQVRCFGRGGVRRRDGGGRRVEDAVAVWSLCLGGQEREKRFLAGEGAERVVCARERAGEILIVFSCCDANGVACGEQLKDQRRVGENFCLRQEERSVQLVGFQRSHTGAHGLAAGEGEVDGCRLFFRGGRLLRAL